MRGMIVGQVLNWAAGGHRSSGRLPIKALRQKPYTTCAPKICPRLCQKWQADSGEPAALSAEGLYKLVGTKAHRC